MRLQHVLCVFADGEGSRVGVCFCFCRCFICLALIYTRFFYAPATSSVKSLCVYLCLHACVKKCVWLAEQGIPGPCCVPYSLVGCTWAPLSTNQMLVIQIRCLISGGTGVELDTCTHANTTTQLWLLLMYQHTFGEASPSTHSLDSLFCFLLVKQCLGLCSPITDLYFTACTLYSYNPTPYGACERVWSGQCEQRVSLYGLDKCQPLTSPHDNTSQHASRPRGRGTIRWWEQ